MTIQSPKLPPKPSVSGSKDASLSPGRQKMVLVVIGLALMAVVSAVSGLNVALPRLASDTGASQTDVTWIVDSYTVVFAGLLLFAGAIGDRFGRRLLLSAGLGIFGVASAAGLLADGAGQLIAIRVTMGIGAAMIMPTTLSIITTSFAEHERPKAVGVWVGIAGGGAVLGLLASGLLLEWFSWASFFGLNVALATLALIGTLAYVPTSVDGEPPSLDGVGALLSFLAILGVVFGIIEGPEQGWTAPITAGSITIGLVAGAAFVIWDLRRREPLLDPMLFTSRGFSAGSITIVVQFFAAFGFFFVMLQYLQFVAGHSPLVAALALLPLPLVLLPTARQAPVAAQRLGFRVLGPVGLASMAFGFAAMTRIQVDSSYWHLVLGLVPFGFGMGLAGTPATTVITSSLPPSRQGVASAWNDTARELGSALGIAILGTLLNQGYRGRMTSVAEQLPAGLADRVVGSVTFVAHADQLGPAGPDLVERGREAFVEGVGNAFVVGAVVLLVAAVAVRFLAPAHDSDRDSNPAATDRN